MAIPNIDLKLNPSKASCLTPKETYTDNTQSSEIMETDKIGASVEFQIDVGNIILAETMAETSERRCDQ